MNTDIQSEIVALAEEFMRSNCVMFIGRDASATYTESLGVRHQGLPTTSQLLEELRASRSFVTQEMSLSQALAVKVSVDGRMSALRFLVDQLGAQLTEPLPIHREIAKLPLSAAIMTSLDTLTERALTSEHIDFHTIIEDVDIPFFRSTRVPVIKLHGSVERPESIVATSDDLLEVFQVRPLVGDLLRVLCAQKTILFVGYDLSDVDFMQFYRLLRRHLGGFLPVSYAIYPDPTPAYRDYWAQQGIRLITADPTDFLQRLNSFILFKSTSPHMILKDSISWIDDPFLRTFLGIGRLPTANQIVDGIATAIVHQLESDLPFETISQRVNEVVASLIEFRPKHRALLHLRDEVIPQWLPPVCLTKADARAKVLDFIKLRSQARKAIGQHGAELVSPDDVILLYSQSTCVLEVVNTCLERQFGRGKIKLVIAECRPKSPEPFQDALTIVRATHRAGSPFLFIPDVAIGHLLKTGQITKVFMGSHGIVILPGNEVRVTNTIGSLSICLLAERFHIPVYFFAEEGKIRTASNLTEAPSISYNLYPEEMLFNDKDPYLLRSLGGKEVDFVNPGFDEISSRDAAFVVVTDIRTIETGPLLVGT